MFDHARDLIQSGVAAQAFPAASIDAGRASGPLWQEAFGHLTYDAAAPACAPDTIFDLASLTKVIATTTLVMRAVEEGRVAIDTPVKQVLRRWQGADRDIVAIRQLLDHSSGLPAHARLFETMSGRAAFEAAIVGMPLAYPPRTQAIYSDLGFILLGFILADLSGRPLADLARATLPATRDLMFLPPASLVDRIAPTEIDPWRGRLLRGDVHDENAAALGGAAGHAGLFGTAAAVGAFARDVLTTFRRTTWIGSPATMSEFASPSDVPGSSRALGWDTMRSTSSCGTLMSRSAIGHTGFTGTSLWIDPDQDLYVVLLTNRVHPTRERAALIPLRPRIHDATVRAMQTRRA